MKKNLDKKVNQISGTGLSRESPRFSPLIVVVTDKFAQVRNIFLTRHLLFHNLILERNEAIEKTFLRRHGQ